MKKNLSRFFVINKALSKYWWHRLFSILFICVFVLVVIANIVKYSSDDLFRGAVGTQQWEEVSPLYNRITSEVMSIGGLAMTKEKIADKERTYDLNDDPDDYYNWVINNVYCSTELFSKFNEVQASRNITELYLDTPSKRVKVTPEIFSNHIKQNNIHCLVVDSIANWNDAGQIIGTIKFLQPDKTYQDNWSYFRVSPTKNIIYFIEMIGTILLVAFLSLIFWIFIYYKVVLYIVFGSEKLKEISGGESKDISLEAKIKTSNNSNGKGLGKRIGIIFSAFLIFIITYKLVKIVFYVLSGLFLNWVGVSVEDSIEMATIMGNFSTILLAVIIFQKTRKIITNVNSNTHYEKSER